jgi:hypothetical protein
MRWRSPPPLASEVTGPPNTRSFAVAGARTAGWGNRWVEVARGSIGRSAMKAQSSIAKRERIGSRSPAAAGGALIIVALASGLALGLGAVVDRLTMPDEEARVLSSAAAQDSTIASAAGVAGRSNKELPAAPPWWTSGLSSSDSATGWSLHAISTNFADYGIQSSVQHEIAPNELRLIGR